MVTNENGVMTDGKKIYDGLSYSIIARLWIIASFTPLRATDFRIWAIASAVGWTLSSALGIVGDFTHRKEQLASNLLGQLSGIFAAITGLLSITGIWSYLKTRHPMITPQANQTVRDYVRDKFGVTILEDVRSTTLSINVNLFEPAIQSLCEFSFVRKESEINLFTAINVMYYARGVHGGFYSPKRLRNALIAERNPLAQMLIRRPTDNSFSGISAILPMILNDWKAYLSSGVSDNLLDPGLVAPHDGENVTKFDVLLFFSSGMLASPTRYDGKSPSQDDADGLLIFVATIYHVLQHMNAAQRISDVDLFVAADDASAIKNLRNLGFRDAHMQTGEGIPLYVVDLRVLR